jgi:hypothetical protein
MCILERLLHPGLLCLILILCFSATVKSAEEENVQSKPMDRSVSMRVLWRVSEYRLSINPVWGDEEARKLLSKPLDITDTTITFDGQKCSNVVFKKETVKTKEYLEKMFHATPQLLGIEDENIEVIKTDCSLPGFAEYFRLRDRRLVIKINGVFFYLEPVVNY